MFRRPAVGLCLAALLAGGCAKSPFPPLYPVTGKVEYEGGQPLGYGMVEFESEGEPVIRGSARVEPDGTLADVVSTLTTGESAAGLVAGTHKVSVSKNVTDLRRNEGKNPIPEKYTSLATTDLRVTVAPGGSAVTITMKPARAGK